MHVRRLELTDFRSYGHVDVELPEGPSVFVGPNGHGKTNLIESLGYLATGSSHRVTSDAPLVRAGCESATARAAIVHEGRELLAELTITPGKANRARLNRSPLPRSRDLIGALKAVVFAPEDLNLIRGEPEQRRRLLDELLIARHPRFAGVRADYDRVVKQRNALLRTAYLARKTGGRGNTDLHTLDTWDAHLAQHGADLLAGRLALIEDYTPYVVKAYEAVSAGRGRPRLSYHSALGENEPLSPDRDLLTARLSAALATARSREVERGTTLVGPHRDDLKLVLGDLPAKGYASHGESWSYALALRLGAAELLRDNGTAPVLILDDVYAELDSQRRERLAELVARAPQVLVTCAVAEDVPAQMSGGRYDIHDGEVRRVI
ncbi:DNA replication/repair protein RecF [Stackebrandtia nassauensis]|uniref:DNA replication and repair protein RecF n=1 Tax=Stackebrandtia nassauensis (strain DSM 44728 / CIP 108903 / NRRL B-16338 / NBRC 102104 / LLR-40K-21) TaxID=446470 RepID=D3PTW9_STANL|nr:DNA replication/repair protein RecF [Stackebrandtia nassauensis]ADD39727.1 DNA replication and repair protein RecF [Stackebrandtia nassauensis DSM 44728]